MRKGFSLIEMVIYIAIVAVTFVLVVNVCLTLSRSYGSLRMAKDIQSAVSTGMERIVKEIRNAESVDAAGSTFVSNNGRLKLSTTYNGSPSTVEFYLADSRLMLSRDGAVQGPLTPQNVAVTALVFNFMSTTTSQAVKVAMTLETSAGSTTKSVSFYDTVVVRGNYR